MVTLVTVIVMPRGNAMKVQVFGCRQQLPPSIRTQGAPRGQGSCWRRRQRRLGPWQRPPPWQRRSELGRRQRPQGDWGRRA